MKRNLFLMMTLATLLFGASSLAFGKEYNMYQTTTNTSKKQLETDKKVAKEKRTEVKKEAEQKRQEAKLTAKNTQKSTKKKHKKFLGIF